MFLGLEKWKIEGTQKKKQKKKKKITHVPSSQNQDVR